MNIFQKCKRFFDGKKDSAPGKQGSKARWILPGVLLSAAVLLGVAFALRPVDRQEVILLTHQSYELPEGGSLTVTGDAVRMQERTLTGRQPGTAKVRIGRLTKIEEYDVSVFVPDPQGDREQRVGVDGYIALAPNPKDYPVVWKSSDPGVATVEDGVVNGVTTGTVTVTETLNDCLTYTYEVTVAQPKLVPEHCTVYPWQEVPVKVLYYSRQVEWSSDSDAVQVNGDGTITSVKPGKANLTAQIGDETFTCRVQVAQLPEMEEQVTLRTDETAQLHMKNALGEVEYHSEDESVVTVDQWGHLAPVRCGTTTVTARCSGQTCAARVSVNLTPEEQFRVSNYGSYQPEDTSIAALAMLGMCDYYNDEMKKSGDTWYDTNMTDFSPADTFQEAISARRQGANCNSLLNWSWHDMDLKKGSGTKIYGMRESGDIHGYHDQGHPLRALVDRCCTVMEAHGEKTRNLEKDGKLQSGDMLFMPLHTFIYRGKGTVFASAGDAKHRRKGSDLIILDCINDYHSYDWRKRIKYIMRFKDDCIPRCYRNKEGEVVENPMYTALQRGESPWTGKLSPAERSEAGLEPVRFTLGEYLSQSDEEADEEQTADNTAETSVEVQNPDSTAASSVEAENPDGSAAASADGSGYTSEATATEEDIAPAPITGNITAEIPTVEEAEEAPRMAGGKPYGSWPSTGKKAKKKSRKSHKEQKTEQDSGNDTSADAELSGGKP